MKDIISFALVIVGLLAMVLGFGAAMFFGNFTALAIGIFGGLVLIAIGVGMGVY